MEVKDDGRTNPIVVVSPDEVLVWLRSMADEAGYSDRETSAVQITVEHEFAEGSRFHCEVPTLVMMVSNIKNSRG